MCGASLSLVFISRELVYSVLKDGEPINYQVGKQAGDPGKSSCS